MLTSKSIGRAITPKHKIKHLFTIIQRRPGALDLRRRLFRFHKHAICTPFAVLFSEIQEDGNNASDY